MVAITNLFKFISAAIFGWMHKLYERQFIPEYPLKSKQKKDFLLMRSLKNYDHIAKPEIGLLLENTSTMGTLGER